MWLSSRLDRDSRETAEGLVTPMAKKSAGKILSDSQLAIATAEEIFGWKNVHKHDSELIGKKQDKLGRWRTAKVPEYSTDPTQAYAIDERISNSDAHRDT